MADFRKKRVGVLMGGPSAERDVSMNTGAGVLRALEAKGYDAVKLEWTSGADLAVALREAKIQVAWIALHGTFGEDGCVQGLLECMKIPYTGSGVTASAIAMDKVLSKRLFDERGIPTPPWHVVTDAADAAKHARTLGYPVVVKPAREGSTVGISIVKSESEIKAAVDVAKKLHGQTLVERFIAGREISVAVLDGEVLGTVEIKPRAAFYDYDAKYLRGDTEYRVPAPMPAEYETPIRDAALDACAVMGVHGHARVDFRIDEKGDGWVLEVNTLPGMTGTSLLPKIAAHAGLDYPSLVERILQSARLENA
jgi:D-alanine-D-alanine ligase